MLETPSSGAAPRMTSVTGGSARLSSGYEVVAYKARLTNVKGGVLRGRLGQW